MPKPNVAAASSLKEDDVFSFSPDGRRFDAVSATTSDNITTLVTTEGTVTVEADTKVFLPEADEPEVAEVEEVAVEDAETLTPEPEVDDTEVLEDHELEPEQPSRQRPAKRK